MATAAACLLLVSFSSAQNAPAPAVPAAAPVAQTAPAATHPTTRPTPDELISSRRAPFNYTSVPISEIIENVSRTYDLHIIDSYKLTDRVTLKTPGDLSGREAIDLVDQILLSMGYTMTEEVRGDPPLLVLRVTAVSRELNLQVYTGNDPDRIPQTDELRTQVFILKYADPEKAKEMILPVLDKKADVVANASNHQLIVTDTAARIHTAAVLIQVVEKQAAPAP